MSVGSYDLRTVRFESYDLRTVRRLVLAYHIIGMRVSSSFRIQKIADLMEEELKGTGTFKILGDMEDEDYQQLKLLAQGWFPSGGF